MPEFYNIRVFVDSHNMHGDVLPIIFDERRTIHEDERLRIARETNAAETVFINNERLCDISIVHAQGELALRVHRLSAQHGFSAKGVKSL